MERVDINTSDDYSLALTLFKPKTSSRATIIFNAATAVPQTFYFPMAKYLAEYGYKCISWDYRGIGKSANDRKRQLPYSLHHWGALDFDAVLGFAHRADPENKILVFAHSIGGIIPGFSARYQLIDGIIGYGVQTAYWRDWKSPQRYKLYLEWHILLPLITKLFGYFPGKKFGLGTNIPQGYIEHWQKRKKHPDIRKLFTEMYRGDVYFGQYQSKMILVNALDDVMSTPNAIDRMHQLYPNACITQIWLSPKFYDLEEIGHFDFFKKKNKDLLWSQCLIWLEGFFDTTPKQQIF